MNDFTSLVLERRGAVDWLTLNRPDALNTLSMAMVDELEAYFSSLCDDHSVRIVVLRANGRAFCAGADLSGEGFDGVYNGTSVYAMQKRIGNIYRAMRRCPQPIIALVHGAACGGGFSLALASDIRIAGESAKMNAAYIRAGFSACDMGCSYFLPRMVGASVASELMMTGRFIHAERALRVNLVSEVVPDAELASAAQPYIDEMLRTTPMGLRLTKEGINQNLDAQSLEAAMALEDRQQSLAALSTDCREAQAAFFEKREPVYVDG
ncbi:enoyl-CoA hydratase/isomerase family protein [Halieaceae bacterium IMCC14734]|uniref:Enoyl-CoA hydratase/isomerase family protein n=1 Tax=Candidatus Litorirhabdus singularis TaxID=2518993 RepID=A0ABT3TFP5_9GAMM|nr:enoyl-CoA hydratase/isomerase family protein [Candidatus Litorirhabdus singularis]MCX2981108.1 enoyl-CoA hydratase/isomerase family protein [Candidatus Litorirhabdus singularis]